MSYATDHCSTIPNCLPIHNNRSCITITQNTGNADWFSSASDCESTGGRLVWLHDTNISEFATTQLKTLQQSHCSFCSFFWIGLVQSLGKDDIYFWKRPRNGMSIAFRLQLALPNIMLAREQVPFLMISSLFRKF